MRKGKRSEKLILHELAEQGAIIRLLLRGLSIGQIISMIRKQMGMSQRILSRKSKIPQPTLSLIEQGKGGANLTTLKKILDVLNCDLLLVPILRETIDGQRRKQARRMAERHIRYLKGTMNLEEQEADSRFFKELAKEKEEEWLHSKKKLWEENEE